MKLGWLSQNIGISVKRGKKEIYRDFGEMLFTHFGVSGPVLLSASSYAAKELKKGNWTPTIDQAGLSEEQARRPHSQGF